MDIMKNEGIPPGFVGVTNASGQGTPSGVPPGFVGVTNASDLVPDPRTQQGFFSRHKKGLIAAFALAAGGAWLLAHRQPDRQENIVCNAASGLPVSGADPKDRTITREMVGAGKACFVEDQQGCYIEKPTGEARMCFLVVPRNADAKPR
jgi:hypothetical protein